MDAVDEKIKDAERREEAMAGHLTTLRDAYKAVAADYRRRPRRKCDLGGRITLEEVRSYATTADSLVALFAAAHDLLLAAESPLPVQTCLGYSGKSPALAAEDAVVEGVRRRAREKRVARGENARCIVVADDERVPQVIRRWSGQGMLVHGLPVRKESRPGQHVIALDVAAPVAAAEATEDAPGEDAACPEGGEGNE